MAQFGRPDSQPTSGWIRQDGQSCFDDFCWPVLDEVVPDDLEYIHDTPNPGAGGAFGLSTLEDPGVDTGHILRVRCRQILDGEAAHFQIVLWQQNPFVIIKNTILTDLTDVFTTREINLSEGEAALITNYEELEVFVENETPTGLTEVLVSWIELEIPDAVPPGSLVIVGSGGIEVAGSPTLVLSKDASGIYTLIRGQRFDRVYTRNNNPDETADVVIPTPFGKTGFIGF